MAWTDYSNTVSSGWDTNVGNTSSGVFTAQSTEFYEDTVYIPSTTAITPNNLFDFKTVPGFSSGYLPAGIPDPIANNIDQGGGGGSTRPSSGFIYPRGDY